MIVGSHPHDSRNDNIAISTGTATITATTTTPAPCASNSVVVPCKPDQVLFDDLGLDLDLDLDLDLSLDLDLALQQASSSSPFFALVDDFSSSGSHRFSVSPDGSPASTCLSPPPEPMLPQSWMLPIQSSFGKNQASRFASQQHHHHQHHHRDSSLSSLGSGSVGPESPFPQNFAHPQIAVADSAGDGFQADILPDDESYYQLAKTMVVASQDNGSNNGCAAHANPAAAAYYGAYAGFPGGPGDDVALVANLAQGPMMRQQQAPSQPQQPHPQQHQKHAESVANPWTAGGSAATPTLSIYSSPPDFTPTIPSPSPVAGPSYPMAAAYSTGGDPSMVPRLIARAPPSQPQPHPRIQRLAVPPSPVSTSRGRSPLSDHAAPFGLGLLAGAQAPLTQQQAQAFSAPPTLPQTPQTISPRDAILELNENDVVDSSSLPMFPQNSRDFDNFAHSPQSATSFRSGLPNLLDARIPDVAIPQQYPFIPQQQQHEAYQQDQQQHHSSDEDEGEDETSPLVSFDSPVPSILQPVPVCSTASEDGTYSCTYHGCPLRFDTQLLLQKHKRDGHRQPHGPHSMRSRMEVMAPLADDGQFVNSQSGPHRCNRINPSTGKSCKLVFSRPYDLTRHEDTIHNARKRKMQCEICTTKKTFSRADALTRHFRVCHPHLKPPGSRTRRAREAEA